MTRIVSNYEVGRHQPILASSSIDESVKIGLHRGGKGYTQVVENVVWTHRVNMLGTVESASWYRATTEDQKHISEQLSQLPNGFAIAGHRFRNTQPP